MTAGPTPPGSSQLVPVAVFENGFRELVGVIPPHASLSRRSKISATALGKSPGIRYQNGTWGGYNWLAHEPTVEDVRRWALAGANMCLRAAGHPSMDIDILNPQLSAVVQREVIARLGAAPTRIGRAPKALLMYRLAEGAEPFGRMAIKPRWTPESGH